MTTPASQIAASDINTENGYAATQQMSWDDSIVRTLAQITTPQSQISLLDLRSKTRTISLVYSAPKQNASLLTDFPGQPTSARWQVTINPGVYLWSDSTSIAGLTTGGPFPAGLTIINNGYIMGKGGNGAEVVRGSAPAGGPAISIGSTCTITNNSFIGGGGGGGSGIGGGGAGGGVGGPAGNDPVAAGGAGGAIGQLGSNGVQRGDNTAYWYSGGGGGRIFPGTGGSGGVGGGGGGGAGGGGGGYNGGSGANGGAAGNPGSTGDINRAGGGGGGGGWGAPGGPNPGIIGTGGAGGKAISLNGFSVTRNGTGTTYGVVS